jgi:predicted nucleotidyltransferase
MRLQADMRLEARLRLNDPAVRGALRAFCEKHHILSLAVFGSVLRDDFRVGGDDPSDIDVLVELDPEHIPGWGYYGWGDELSRLWGRKVEILTSEELSRHFVQKVLQQAVTLYERERSSLTE